MGLDTKVLLRITATLTKAADLISTGIPASISLSENFNLTDGTAVGNADRIFFDSISLSGTTPQNQDFAPFTDIFGASVTMVKMKMLYAKAGAGNTQSVILGNHATAALVAWFGATGEITLKAGAKCYFDDPAGFTVTATTADMLKMVGGGAGTHALDLIAVGTSA